MPVPFSPCLILNSSLGIKPVFWIDKTKQEPSFKKHLLCAKL